MACWLQTKISPRRFEKTKPAVRLLETTRLSDIGSHADGREWGQAMAVALKATGLDEKPEDDGLTDAKNPFRRSSRTTLKAKPNAAKGRLTGKSTKRAQRPHPQFAKRIKRAAQWVLRQGLEEPADRLFHHRIAAARIREDRAALGRTPVYSCMETSARHHMREALLLLAQATSDTIGTRTLIIQYTDDQNGAPKAEHDQNGLGLTPSLEEDVDILSARKGKPLDSDDVNPSTDLLSSLSESYGCIFVEQPSPRKTMPSIGLIQAADRVMVFAEEGRTSVPELEQITAVLNTQAGIEPELILTERETLIDVLARFAHASKP